MSYFQDLLDRTNAALGAHLPTLLLAVGILVVGWLLARIVSSLVRRALNRTDIDNRVAAWVTGKKEDSVNIERWMGKLIFFVLMLFVLIAFFQTLGLTGVINPLNSFLTEIFAFLPRLIGPAILALAAWVVASILRYVVRQALETANLDKRFADSTESDKEKPLPLSQTLSEAVYWLVFLFFLPAILSPLGLDGLLAPVQNLVDKLLSFLPQLLAAVLILAVGWFVARIVQRIVTSLLAAVGVDGFAEQVGLENVLGKQRLSGLLGTLLYVLILVPVLIASLEALEIDSITGPASQMLNTILLSIPNIFAAAFVLLIAYVVARIVSGLLANLLAAAGFNTIPARLGFSGMGAGEGRAASDVAGMIVTVAIMLFAATEAARLLGFEVVGELIAQFTVFAGQVILGVVIFGIGLFLANLAANAIRASEISEAGILAFAARLAIIVLTAAMALRRMGLANEIINLAFGLTLGAIAVAIALAFGLGARDVAAQEVSNWRKRFRAE